MYVLSGTLDPLRVDDLALALKLAKEKARDERCTIQVTRVTPEGNNIVAIITFEEAHVSSK